MVGLTSMVTPPDPAPALDLSALAEIWPASDRTEIDLL
jgi:hypothetical protein